MLAALIYRLAVGAVGVAAIGGIVCAGHESLPTPDDDNIIHDYLLQVTPDLDDGSAWPNSPFVG